MKEINLTVRAVFFGLFALACSTTSPTTQQEERVPESVQTKEIRVNGVTLTSVERGTGDPVVFVHGALGDYRTWDGQIEAFAQKYRVISYSRRYHYPNPWPGDDSISSVPTHVEDLVALVRALNLGPVHLVGHSGGAVISLNLARDYPELLRSLTLGEPGVFSLFAPGSEGDTLVQNRRADTSAADAFERGDDREGVRRFLIGVLGEDAFEKLAPPVLAHLLDNARTRRLKRSQSPSFACEDAGKLQIPTLLLEGETTLRMFTLVQDILEQCLPNKERATIPSASHGLEYDNPLAFNETVLAFLARH